VDVILLPSTVLRTALSGRPEDHGLPGEPPAGDRELEDWVASTMAFAGEQSLGVTSLPMAGL
jgi:hypothetical protein